MMKNKKSAEGLTHREAQAVEDGGCLKDGADSSLPNAGTKTFYHKAIAIQLSLIILLLFNYGFGFVWISSGHGFSNGEPFCMNCGNLYVSSKLVDADVGDVIQYFRSPEMIVAHKVINKSDNFYTIEMYPIGTEVVPKRAVIGTRMIELWHVPGSFKDVCESELLLYGDAENLSHAEGLCRYWNSRREG